MTDDAKNDSVGETGQQQAAKPEGTGSSTAGLKKYLLPGGIGIAVIVVTMVLVMVFAGGQKSSQVADETTEPTTVAKEQNAENPAAAADTLAALKGASDAAENLDFLLDESDQSVIDQITASLEFLDYDPEEEALAAEEAAQGSGMSEEDSLEAVDWLKSEKAALAEREKDLTRREEELERQSQEVQRKILVIEQAESTRIAKLAKLYDGMDARAVTRLMANLDDSTVVAVISRMKQKNASQVMALLSPQRAARLSKMMITIAEN